MINRSSLTRGASPSGLAAANRGPLTPIWETQRHTLTNSSISKKQKAKKFNSLAIDGQPPISMTISLKLCDIFQSSLKRAGVSPAGIVIIL